MSAAIPMPRRGLAGFLGFVAAAPASAGRLNHRPGADDRLAIILAELQAADKAFRLISEENEAGQEAALEEQDKLMMEAAFLGPITDRGFAVKARIARIYGDSSLAGQQVQRMLFSDLMIRGRMPLPVRELYDHSGDV